MRRRAGAVAFLAAAVSLALAGCGTPEAALRDEADGAEEPVWYETAIFALARGGKIRIVLFRQMGTAGAPGEADFEYVFLDLPEKRRYGWLRDDRVPAYRWTHTLGQDRIWLGTMGHVSLRFFDNKQRLRLDLEMTMRPVGETAGRPYVYEAEMWVTEEVVRTQELIDRYGARLAALVEQAESAAPGPKRAIKKEEALIDEGPSWR